MPYKNIGDGRKRAKKYYQKNREQILKHQKKRRINDSEYREKCNERSNKCMKKRYAEDPEFRKRTIKKTSEYQKKQYIENPAYKERKKELYQNWLICLREKTPWVLHWKAAYRRCNDPNIINYKRYGGKGIQMLLTKKQIEILWVRDKACLLKQPSIDRINSKDNYHFGNCRFIELSENSRRRRCRP